MSSTEFNKKIPKHSFASRNMVTLVMVPALVAMHYGWLVLQDNKSLVADNEKIDLPLITAAKYMWNKMQGSIPEKEAPVTE